MITMKEIGKLAGVSQPTVSVVLNGKGDEKGIAKETQKRIFEIAQQYGFRANAIARSMKTGKTGIIGILVKKEAMLQVVKTLESNLATTYLHSSLLLAGCRVMFEIVDESDCNDLRMPGILTEGLVDGIILFSSSNDEEQFGKYLKKMNQYTPYILLVDEITSEDISSVSVDEELVGINAANCLWERGYRSFGMISCAEHRLGLDLRLNAFEKRIEELSNHQIKVAKGFAGNRWELDCGRFAIAELLAKEGKCPEAIFCANDFFAYGAEKELLERGYSIPNDVALLGVGNTFLAENLPVPIATFTSSLEEQTQAVLDIFDAWKKNQSGVVKKTINAVLQPRKSIGYKNIES